MKRDKTVNNLTERLCSNAKSTVPIVDVFCLQAKLLPGRYNLYGNSLEFQVKYIEKKKMMVNRLESNNSLTLFNPLTTGICIIHTVVARTPKQKSCPLVNGLLVISATHAYEAASCAFYLLLIQQRQQEARPIILCKSFKVEYIPFSTTTSLLMNHTFVGGEQLKSISIVPKQSR